jgi:predicted phosphate transport protein (TIGR00153 family)
MVAAMGFKEWIIPQDRAFYDLLETLGKHTSEITAEFKFLLTHWSNLEIQRQKVKAIEHAADEAMHELFERLNRTFITPIDREDIARLAHALDEVIDSVYAATNRIVLFDIPEPTAEMMTFAEILEKQVTELVDGLGSLRKPATMAKHILPHAVEMHRLENEADRLLYRITAELFKGKDAVHIMKYKELYEHLEYATDSCEDVADVLRDIVRKHG